MKRNPWKGLVSYKETDLDEYDFCGRTKAIGRYYSLVTDSLFSTLYGKTGCGKTSMLQIGIFPLLRQEGYFPVLCRLALTDSNESYSDYIIEQIEREGRNLGYSFTESEISIDNVNNEEKHKLWKYFYGHKFRGTDGNEVFPVIVLDQFEEVLINSQKKSRTLLEQISCLIGDDLLLPEECYANFRVTVSLREDYLYLLEDIIDEGKIRGLRDNRMRLTSLSDDDAKQVILIGSDYMPSKDTAEICSNIISMSKDKNGSISTNMLSLICSQLWNYSNGNITIQRIQEFTKDPLKDFCLACYSKISKETRSFIESNLINGDRKSIVSESKLRQSISREDFNTLTDGKYKMLQYVMAGNVPYMELIHDSLAKAIGRIVDERKRRNNKQWYLLLFVFVALVIGLFSIKVINDINTKTDLCSISIRTDDNNNWKGFVSITNEKGQPVSIKDESGEDHKDSIFFDYNSSKTVIAELDRSSKYRLHVSYTFTNDFAYKKSTFELEDRSPNISKSIDCNVCVMEGRVVSADSVTVRNGLIVMDNYSTRTDENGKFTLRFNKDIPLEGNGNLVFIHRKYKPYSIPIIDFADSVFFKKKTLIIEVQKATNGDSNVGLIDLSSESKKNDVSYTKSNRLDSLIQYLYNKDIKASDLKGLKQKELYLLRNSLYARAGYRFHSRYLNKFFRKYSWYSPDYESTSDLKLTDRDKNNITIIKNLELKNMPATVTVIGDRVRLRKSPTTDDDNVQFYVKNGTVLKFISAEEEWYKVNYEGHELFVHQDLVQ